MTVRDTIPFGLQAFLYFVEGRMQERPPSLEQTYFVNVVMAQVRSLCDNFLPKISTDASGEDSVKNNVIIFLASSDAYFTKAEEHSDCRIVIQCMVTILCYVNGQEQKFKDAPKVTALSESLVFPQIKKTAWMGKAKLKLVSTVLHNAKQFKTDERKTGCPLAPETLCRHHVVIFEKSKCCGCDEPQQHHACPLHALITITCIVPLHA
jgi:hypothetical protein